MRGERWPSNGQIPEFASYLKPNDPIRNLPRKRVRMFLETQIWETCQRMASNPSIQRSDGGEFAFRRWFRTYVVSTREDKANGRMFVIEDPRDHGKAMLFVQRTSVISARSMCQDQEMGRRALRRLRRFLRHARPVTA